MLRVAHSRMGVLLRFATTQEKVASIFGREGALRARIEVDVGCEIGGSNWNCLTIWLWGDECQGWRDVQGCSSREGRVTEGHGGGPLGALWGRRRHLVYAIWCHHGGRGAAQVSDEAVESVGADTESRH